MDAEQCDRLIHYVRALSPPVLRTAPYEISEPSGYAAFETIGCTTCHTPRLGEVNGIYSDLLLHDMGQSLGDAATYYGSSTTTESPGDIASARASDRSRRERRRRPNGARRPCGASRIRPLISTTAGRARSTRPSGSTAARPPRSRPATGSSDDGDRQELLAFLHSLTAAPKLRKPSPAAARRAAERGKRSSQGEGRPDGVENSWPSGKN